MSDNTTAAIETTTEAPAATPKKTKPAVEVPKTKRFAVSVSATSPVRMVRSAGLLFSPVKEILSEGDPALAELRANAWLTVEEVTE